MQQQREEAQQPTSRALLEDNLDYDIEGVQLQEPTEESRDEVAPIEIPDAPTQSPVQETGDVGEPEVRSEPDEPVDSGEPDLPDSPVAMEGEQATPVDGSEPAVAGEEEIEPPEDVPPPEEPPVEFPEADETEEVEAIEPPQQDAVDMPEEDEWYDPGPEFIQRVEKMFADSEQDVPDDVVGRMTDAMDWQSALLARADSLE